jgi:hypothetical protein
MKTKISQNNKIFKRLLKSLKPYWKNILPVDLKLIHSFQERTKNGKYTLTNKQVDIIRMFCKKYIGVVINGVRYIECTKERKQLIVPKSNRKDNGIFRQSGLKR